MISFALEEDQQLIQETVRKFAAEEMRPKLRDLEKAAACRRGCAAQFHELGLGLLDARGGRRPGREPGDGGAGARGAGLRRPGRGGGAVGAAPGGAGDSRAGRRGAAKRLLGRFAGTTATRDWARSPGASAARRCEASHDRPSAGRRRLVARRQEGVRRQRRGRRPARRLRAGRRAPSGWDGIGAFVVEARRRRAAARRAPRAARPRGGARRASCMLEGCSSPRPTPARRRRARAARSSRCSRARSLIDAARQVGLARAAYEFALEYTQERKAFGKPVGHFQAIAFTLAEWRWTSTRRAGWCGAPRAAIDENAARRDARSSRAGRAHANEAAWRVADNGVQLLGGAGYMQDYPGREVDARRQDAGALRAARDQLVDAGVAAPSWATPVGDRAARRPRLQPFFT